MSLHVHAVALEAVRALRPLVDAIARHDRDLSRQLRDAASSMVLNIGEGERSGGGNVRARLDTASGSTRESRSALATAAAWGYVSAESTVAADALLDRVSAMLHRLVHPRR